ncbi:Dipeptide transport system permease protein DppC [Pseudonocardia sp. Ae406_Ps2]|uniref:ABC transporter permease n=1 Tax=unclassified Pseudonocardia TaxID=2619320 RepID=UPI00094B0270|nr:MULTISPECIES: ABC transporter permease [unclassified Pseudonocardia]OLL99849.1 Dipeptide transport system permease protein DppC [Pseudonocardia sp. Ae331_Ps2]OLM02401.1 Dipeptide transport system permease protein DppC [Pseudonocardia sp. Ae406_Ps2]OLM12763.1 Dipeptide transport system permease protein DppC [Pseudonocardia sp. Ae505_Ps2]OLM23972.1 Dipeptide transport system permease protein DppC [Pseudonocardia sp. Ae706_Ps2]OLM30076.1 Dipeptide transport system permease protein DppC [Pseudo
MTAPAVGGTGTVRRGARRRFARTPVAVVSWALVLAYVLLAVAGPLLVTGDPLRQSPSALLPMGSPGHLLGTDDLGRDQLVRLVHGAQPLLMVALAATALATVVGVAIGLAAGYLGGRAEQLLMRLTDVALAFPSVLLIILLVAAAGPGTSSLVVGVGIALAPGIARLMRALAARESARDHVLASRMAGTGGLRIALTEVLPGTVGPLLVQVLTTLSVAAGFAAGMSYLGLGIQPPTPDWGYMVQSGQEFLYTAPSLVVLPALATLVFVVACNFVGDDVRDALDRKGTP